MGHDRKKFARGATRRTDAFYEPVGSAHVTIAAGGSRHATYDLA
jgi:hypothetical protein